MSQKWYKALSNDVHVQKRSWDSAVGGGGMSCPSPMNSGAQGAVRSEDRRACMTPTSMFFLPHSSTHAVWAQTLEGSESQPSVSLGALRMSLVRDMIITRSEPCYGGSVWVWLKLRGFRVGKAHSFTRSQERNQWDVQNLRGNQDTNSPQTGKSGSKFAKTETATTKATRRVNDMTYFHEGKVLKDSPTPTVLPQCGCLSHCLFLPSWRSCPSRASVTLLVLLLSRLGQPLLSESYLEVFSDVLSTVFFCFLHLLWEDTGVILFTSHTPRKLQTHIPTCLLDASTWISYRDQHLVGTEGQNGGEQFLLYSNQPSLSRPSPLLPLTPSPSWAASPGHETVQWQ